MNRIVKILDISFIDSFWTLIDFLKKESLARKIEHLIIIALSISILRKLRRGDGIIKNLKKMIFRSIT